MEKPKNNPTREQLAKYVSQKQFAGNSLAQQIRARLAGKADNTNN